MVSVGMISGFCEMVVVSFQDNGDESELSTGTLFADELDLTWNLGPGPWSNSALREVNSCQRAGGGAGSYLD